jgi:hypothetical protein
MYRFLFEMLKQKFGPYRHGLRNDEQYKSFCKAFAELIGAASGDAVDLQVMAAVDDAREIRSRGEVLRRAAAYTTEFIPPPSS